MGIIFQFGLICIYIFGISELISSSYGYGLPISIGVSIVLTIIISSKIRSTCEVNTQSIVSSIHDKTPEDGIQIKTAYDTYENMNNVIVSNLQNEVNKKLNALDLSYISSKRMTMGLFIIFILMIGIFGALYQNNVYVKNNPVDDVYNKLIDSTYPNINNTTEENEPSMDVNLNQSANIVLDKEKISINIDSSSSKGMSIREDDSSTHDNFTTSTSGDVYSKSSDIYNENIPEKYDDTIKEYFS
jgi:hypothetical protein